MRGCLYNFEVFEKCTWQGDMLKASSSLGVDRFSNANLFGVRFSNANLFGDSLDRRSIFGYCTFIGRNLVTWKSKKQNVVARSRAFKLLEKPKGSFFYVVEAKCIAMSDMTCEMMWVKSLLQEMGISITKPMRIYIYIQPRRYAYCL